MARSILRRSRLSAFVDAGLPQRTILILYTIGCMLKQREDVQHHKEKGYSVSGGGSKASSSKMPMSARNWEEN
jgi:hypothetical protein